MQYIKKSRLLFLTAVLLPLIGVFTTCDGQKTSQSDAVAARPAESEPQPNRTADPACIEFQKLVDQTYDFKPTKLTKTEQTAKSAAMDVVWEKVKNDQKRTMPCLVSALELPSANAFFKFDGSRLLLSLDNSEASKKLAIKSHAGTELEDVDLQSWIAFILKSSLEGLDTSEAGDAWLKAKDPFYYLPQHGALKIDKRTGALAIYGSMDEQQATPALAKIASQKEHPGRQIAVDLLSKQVTPEALRALSKLDQSGLSNPVKTTVNSVLNNPIYIQKREGEPQITRAEYIKAFQELAGGRGSLFMDLAGQVTDGEKDAVAVLLPEDVPLVRKARRFFASTGTPHAPEWYQSFTDILMVIVWKSELEKQKAGKE